MVMSQFSICNKHFGIMKSELILGTSVGILTVLNDKIFFLSSARRQIPLFAISQNSDNALQEVSIIVRVSECEAASVIFLSIFAPRHF